jgi:hypothetical protein
LRRRLHTLRLPHRISRRQPHRRRIPPLRRHRCLLRRSHLRLPLQHLFSQNLRLGPPPRLFNRSHLHRPPQNPFRRSQQRRPPPNPFNRSQLRQPLPNPFSRNRRLGQPLRRPYSRR